MILLEALQTTGTIFVKKKNKRVTFNIKTYQCHAERNPYHCNCKRWVYDYDIEKQNFDISTYTLFFRSTVDGFLFIKLCTQSKVHTKLSFNQNSSRKCEANVRSKKNSHCVKKDCLVLLIISKNINHESRKSRPVKQC